MSKYFICHHCLRFQCRLRSDMQRHYETRQKMCDSAYAPGQISYLDTYNLSMERHFAFMDGLDPKQMGLNTIRKIVEFTKGIDVSLSSPNGEPDVMNHVQTTVTLKLFHHLSKESQQDEIQIPTSISPSDEHPASNGDIETSSQGEEKAELQTLVSTQNPEKSRSITSLTPSVISPHGVPGLTPSVISPHGVPGLTCSQCFYEFQSKHGLLKHLNQQKSCINRRMLYQNQIKLKERLKEKEEKAMQS